VVAVEGTLTLSDQAGASAASVRGTGKTGTSVRRTSQAGASLVVTSVGAGEAGASLAVTGVGAGKTGSGLTVTCLAVTSLTVGAVATRVESTLTLGNEAGASTASVRRTGKTGASVR
jgi:hypothetical protein